MNPRLNSINRESVQVHRVRGLGWVVGVLWLGLAAAFAVRLGATSSVFDYALIGIFFAGGIRYFVSELRSARAQVRWTETVLEFSIPGRARPEEAWFPVRNVEEDGVSFLLVGDGHRKHLRLDKRGLSDGLRRVLTARSQLQ